eukprot:1177227-Prorocentrum_minimum.AAC.1
MAQSRVTPLTDPAWFQLSPGEGGGPWAQGLGALGPNTTPLQRILGLSKHNGRYVYHYLGVSARILDQIRGSRGNIGDACHIFPRPRFARTDLKSGRASERGRAMSRFLDVARPPGRRSPGGGSREGGRATSRNIRSGMWIRSGRLYLYPRIPGPGIRSYGLDHVKCVN